MTIPPNKVGSIQQCMCKCKRLYKVVSEIKEGDYEGSYKCYFLDDGAEINYSKFAVARNKTFVDSKIVRLLYG